MCVGLLNVGDGGDGCSTRRFAFLNSPPCDFFARRRPARRRAAQRLSRWPARLPGPVHWQSPSATGARQPGRGDRAGVGATVGNPAGPSRAPRFKNAARLLVRLARLRLKLETGFVGLSNNSFSKSHMFSKLQTFLKSHTNTNANQNALLASLSSPPSQLHNKLHQHFHTPPRIPLPPCLPTK